MVKEFLEEVRKMPAEVHAAEARLAQIRAEAVLLKSPKLGDKVQNSRQDGIDAIVARMEEQREKALQKWGKLLDMRSRAGLIIDLLPDPTQRAVLTEYYVLGYTWDKVADDLYYSKAGAIHLRDQAVDFLEKNVDAQSLTKLDSQIC